jgi:pyridoxamine 5'-phosphate oxidase
MAPSDPLTDPRADPLTGWRTRLRAVPVFDDDLPAFDAASAPEDPLELVAEWLDNAIVAGVPQPHAAAFITVDASGRPSSRTLILKDLNADGLWVATPSTSPAGRDLAANPAAALQVYWPKLGRQIRVEGDAEAGPAAVSRADWEARSPAARAATDPATWTAYVLRPARIEFQAAAVSRAHTRLLYERAGGAPWSHGMLAE